MYANNLKVYASCDACPSYETKMKAFAEKKTPDIIRSFIFVLFRLGLNIRFFKTSRISSTYPPLVLHTFHFPLRGTREKLEYIDALKALNYLHLKFNLMIIIFSLLGRMVFKELKSLPKPVKMYTKHSLCLLNVFINMD